MVTNTKLHYFEVIQTRQNPFVMQRGISELISKNSEIDRKRCNCYGLDDCYYWQKRCISNICSWTRG